MAPIRDKFKLFAVASAAVFALAMPVAVRADEDNDSDLARDLYQHGKIRPLYEILRVVHAHASGDIVAIELTRAGGQSIDGAIEPAEWVYHFQIVAPDGHRETLSVDAATATVIPEESREPQ